MGDIGNSFFPPYYGMVKTLHPSHPSSLATLSLLLSLSPRASRQGGLDETVSALPSRCFDRRRRLVRAASRLLAYARSKKRRFRDATQTFRMCFPGRSTAYAESPLLQPCRPRSLPANRVTGRRDRSGVFLYRWRLMFDSTCS